MAVEIKSQSELYDLFLTTLRDNAPDLTDDSEGSIIDSIGGVVSLAASEILRVAQDRYAKTFFNTAHGPEITGSTDDLQTLAVDHFGTSFSRPGASSATGIVNFSRANTDAGDIVISAGTVVKTKPNAQGVSQRFETESEVTMTGTSVNASAVAVEAGVDGNVLSGTITEIESTLLDSSIVVTNAAAFSGGEAQQDDSAYRETIRNLIEALRGATLAAIEAKAKTVPGIETATAIEIEYAVRRWDIGGDVATGPIFRIPYVTLYVADANGTANDALVDDVKAAIDAVRAGGVSVTVQGASALPINWTAAITLNPSGPNYSELSSDPTKITDSMAEYIASLPIGQDFIRDDADAAILAIWGAAGTNDLTDFVTSVPVGDVSASNTQKLIAGTMAVE